MARSIILYGPQGCGKTRNSSRIARAYGLTVIVDEAGEAAMPFRSNVGVLYITGNEDFAKRKMARGWNIVHYSEAMQHLAFLERKNGS
jgi:shikimate kinase